MLLAGGGTNAAVDLSDVAALQGLSNQISVTFRLVNYGGTSASGTWYAYDYAGSPALDLAVRGTVTALVPDAGAAPILAGPGFTNGQFGFTVLGAAGSNYVVEAALGLHPPVWLPVVTNTPPFEFRESRPDSGPHRFYRGRLVP